MTMKFENVDKVVQTFKTAPAARQAEYKLCAKTAEEAVEESLPALAQSDRAAVAWYVAELMTQLREVHAKDLGMILTDTAAGYALAAAQLIGIEL